MAAARGDLARQERIEEDRLRLKFKGLTLEEELLKLEYRRAYIQAKADGEHLGRVNEEFALKWALLHQGQETAAIEMRATGTFNPNAIRGLEGGNLVQKQAKDIGQIEVNTRRLLEWVRGQGGLVFG
jgi:hypothetical protein